MLTSLKLVICSIKHFWICSVALGAVVSMVRQSMRPALSIKNPYMHGTMPDFYTEPLALVALLDVSMQAFGESFELG